MLKGKGKFYIQEGRGGIIRISTDLIKDSQFPFKHRDNLEIKIVKKRLVISK
jgi:hypothetical protein